MSSFLQGGILPPFGIFPLLDGLRDDAVTGVIRLDVHGKDVRIYVIEGRPRLCVGSSVEHTFAAQLLRRQRFTHSVLRSFLQRSKEQSVRLQDLLVVEHLITAEEGQGIVGELSEHIFGELAGAASVRFKVRKGNPPSMVRRFVLHPVAAYLRWARSFDESDPPTIAAPSALRVVEQPGWKAYERVVRAIWEPAACQELTGMIGGATHPGALSKETSRLLVALSHLGLIRVTGLAAPARGGHQPGRVLPAFAAPAAKHAGSLLSKGVPSRELENLGALLEAEFGVTTSQRGARRTAPPGETQPVLAPSELATLPQLQLGRSAEPSVAAGGGVRPSRYAVPEGVTAPPGDAGLAAALQRAVAAAEAEGEQTLADDDLPETFSAPVDIDKEATLADAARVAEGRPKPRRGAAALTAKTTPVRRAAAAPPRRAPLPAASDVGLKALIPPLEAGRAAPDDPVLAGLLAVRQRFRVSDHFTVLGVEAGAPMSVIRDAHARLKAKYSLATFAGAYVGDDSKKDLELIRTCLDQAAADLMDPARRKLIERLAGGPPEGFHPNRYFEAEVIYRRGRRRFARKGYLEAVDLFRQSAAQNADEPIYPLWLARSLRKQHEVSGPLDPQTSSEVRRLLEGAISLGHRCEEAELDLAGLYRELRLPEKALELYQRVLSTNPKHAVARRAVREVHKELEEATATHGVAGKLGELFGRRGKKK